MKLLKRNLTSFDYRACLGQVEVLETEGTGQDVVTRHTGRYTVQYADPVSMTGSMSYARDYIANQWFGIDDRYTHTMLIGSVDTGIREDGLIDWKGDTYEIRAIRESINVTALALRKLDHKG